MFAIAPGAGCHPGASRGGCRRTPRVVYTFAMPSKARIQPQWNSVQDSLLAAELCVEANFPSNIGVGSLSFYRYSFSLRVHGEHRPRSPGSSGLKPQRLKTSFAFGPHHSKCGSRSILLLRRVTIGLNGSTTLHPTTSCTSTTYPLLLPSSSPLVAGASGGAHFGHSTLHP